MADNVRTLYVCHTLAINSYCDCYTNYRQSLSFLLVYCMTTQRNSSYRDNSFKLMTH